MPRSRFHSLSSPLFSRLLVAIPCVCLAVAGLAVTGLAADDQPSQPESQVVAGRTLDQYVQQLADSNRVVQIRAVRSLEPFGAAAADALRDGLDHSDPAIRYIAAAALGRLGGASLDDAVERLNELARDDSSDDDSSDAVQLAAAYALCESGRGEEYLELLIERLRHPSRAMACSAAEFLGALGQDAQAAVQPLREVSHANRPGGRGDYHVGGAAKNALRRIKAAQQSEPVQQTEPAQE